MPTGEPLELALALIRCIDDHALDRVPQLYADDARIEDPGGAKFVGGEQLKGHLARLVTAFPDIHHEVLHTIQDGSSAAVQGRITGTHTGPLALPGRTVEPTGRSIDLRFAFLIQAQDGRIVIDDLYLDRADMAAQLGLD
jgi:predicted ester cyclase